MILFALPIPIDSKLTRPASGCVGGWVSVFPVLPGPPLLFAGWLAGGPIA